MILAALVAIVAMAAPQPVAAGTEGKSFGKGLAGAQEVKVVELVANPEKYVGKTVRVEGVVVDVCEKRGCWMDIADGAKAAKVRIKVDDGVMVFPVEAKGSHAIAEGVFTKIEMTPDEAKAYAKHLAEEKGQALEANAAPTVLYQIKGTGAVIK
jgi:hypothetical protein